MKQVMNYHKDNGLLNMIRRTDPSSSQWYTYATCSRKWKSKTC